MAHRPTLAPGSDTFCIISVCNQCQKSGMARRKSSSCAPWPSARITVTPTWIWVKLTSLPAGWRESGGPASYRRRSAPLSFRAHNALSEFYFDRRQLPSRTQKPAALWKIEPTSDGTGTWDWWNGSREIAWGAERAFLRAAALSPSDSPVPLYARAFLYGLRPDCRAIREYRAGVQIDPTR